MWARRLGCPALWPSRIKVVVMSWLLVGCMFAFFDFLRSADISYVDLRYPQEEQLTCGMSESYCSRTDNPLDCVLRFYEPFFASVDLAAALSGGACPRLPDAPERCAEVLLPIMSLQSDLSQLHTVNRRLNPLRSWAWLFLCLMAVLVSAIAVHDLALLQERCRPKILSMRSVKQELPKLWATIWALQCGEAMRWLRVKSCIVWAIALPVWFLCQVCIFLTIIYPLSLFAGACWWCPLGAVRVSRVMVFQSGILVFFWTLIFVFVTAFSPVLVGVDHYSVLWNAERFGTGCICHCQYPLRAGTTRYMLFIGIMVAVWSASVAFRSLKGLRRPNWSNLYSVLYTVPIEAFPVEWERPAEAGGGPINLRTDSTVQSEPAFDPFCLMDEQPESGRSRVKFFPVPQSDAQVGRWSRSRDPTSDATIGCCGFPQKQLMRVSQGDFRKSMRSMDSFSSEALEKMGPVKTMPPLYDECTGSNPDQSAGEEAESDRIELEFPPSREGSPLAGSAASLPSSPPSPLRGGACLAEGMVAAACVASGADTAAGLPADGSSGRGYRDGGLVGRQTSDPAVLDDDEESVIGDSPPARDWREVCRDTMSDEDFGRGGCGRFTMGCGDWVFGITGPRLPSRALPGGGRPAPEKS